MVNALPTKADFDAAAEAGLVNAKRCPVGAPLTLYSYTKETQYSRAWNPVTMAARGLVLHDDGHAVAHPFDKFFNLGEHESTQPGVLPPSVPQLAHKYDGSLIIVFRDESRPAGFAWRAVTRGSWEGPQARRAQGWLDVSPLKLALEPGVTYMFEYVSPANRIVIPYDEERFVLLGTRDAEGRLADYRESQELGKSLRKIDLLVAPLEFDERPLADVNLDAALADTAEGFVALWPEHGLRVKLKYAEYKRLHRLLTEFSRKALWECLATGAGLPDLKKVPNDFRAWYKAERDALQDRFDATSKASEVAFDTILAGRKRQEAGADRKAFAQAVDAYPRNLHPILFKLLDGKTTREIVWKQIKPGGDEAYATFQKDNDQ